MRQSKLDPIELARRANADYWTREQLRHHLPPGIALDALWADIERSRQAAAQALPLLDASGRPFVVYPAPRLQRAISSVDRFSAESAFLAAPRPPAVREIQFDALIAEAYGSSRVEGAATTFAKARDLAAGKVQPRTKSERMVLNNFLAMQQILEWRTRALTADDLLALHRVLMHGAYEGPPGTEGRFRNTDDVTVKDLATDEIVHVPPPAAVLLASLDGLLAWLAAAPARERGAGFVAPLVQAAAAHYYLAYLHPFPDGNGRTARALFYHCMLRHGYESFRYISISTAIEARRARYYRAFRDVQASPADLTYFAAFQGEAAEEAIEAAHRRLAREVVLPEIEGRLARRAIVLNARQERWLRRLLREPEKPFGIDALERAYGVSYPTARSDVLDLVEKRLVAPSGKRGRKQLYRLDPRALLS